MSETDFTIDNKYTYTPITREINRKTLLTKVKKELATLLNTNPEEIYIVGNIKPWYFIPHLLSAETLRNTNIILDNENINLITLSRLIRKSGMTTIYLQIPPKLNEKIFEGLKVTTIYTLMTTLIQPKTGTKVKIQNILKYLKSNEVKILVDGSYATGAIKTDIRRLGIDLYLSEGHYWLESPKDTGFIYIKRGSLDIPRINIEGEEKNLVELIGLQEPTTKYNILLTKLNEINKVKIENIENHILSLGGWLIDELNKMKYDVRTPINRDERGGIITIKVGRHAEYIHRTLREKHGIYIDKLGDHLRISIKKRHREKHITQLLEALGELKRKLVKSPP